MKRNFYILHAILFGMIYFSIQGPAFGGEKSIIIGFHRQPGPSEEALISNARGTVRHTHKLIPAIAAKLPEQEIDRMLHDPRIAYIEEDAVVSLVQPLPGNEYANSWGVQHIGAGMAYNNNIRGTGVKIAVLDTGIDCTHPDLQHNCRWGDNFVEYLDNSHPLPMDDSYNSHGTNVAGIIAALRNGFGVVGVAPKAKVYAVKVLDAIGFGTLSSVIAGIEWAVENHMDIINISISAPSDYQSLKDACDCAYKSGLLIVAAAGNTYGGPVTYPAAYDSVIAVTATDKNDQLAVFSAVGPEIELSAPGINILSAAIGGVYASLSGTSQAAPHVAGTAALILSSIDREEESVNYAPVVRQWLQQTAKDLGAFGKDYIYGYGLVNAAKARIPEEFYENDDRKHRDRDD